MAGAILVQGGSQLTLTNCDISNNQVLYGSIITIVQSEPTVLSGLTMNENSGGSNIMVTGSNLILSSSSLTNSS
jgi:hypothetical protein